MSGITDGPKGIDVSKWQPDTPSLVGLDFLIARASIGTSRDLVFAEHIANAKKAGLVTGAYHFNWPSIPIADQVRAFVAAVRAVGGVDLHFIDVENAGSGLGQFSRTETRAFIAGVRAELGKCGLYMSESGFYTDVANDYRWVANWSQPPTIAWKFWQYQGSPLDKNRFNGDLADLQALAGDTMAQRSITTSTPRLIRIIAGQDIFDLDGTTKLADAPAELTDVLSPVGRGTDAATGNRFREWYTDISGSKRSVLSKVNDVNIKPVPEPVCPEPEPADCSAVEAELAAKKETVNTQSAIIASLETELAEANLTLARTFANIDALKG